MERVGIAGQCNGGLRRVTWVGITGRQRTCAGGLRGDEQGGPECAECRGRDASGGCDGFEHNRCGLGSGTRTRCATSGMRWGRSSRGSETTWGRRMQWVDKKELARTRKLPLEFTEAMYKALDPWHGQRMIMANCMGSIVDTERDASSQPVSNRFGRVRRAGEAGASSPGSTVPRSNVATGSPSSTSRAMRPNERAVSSCPGNGVPARSAATATPHTASSMEPRSPQGGNGRRLELRTLSGICKMITFLQVMPKK